MVSDDTTDDCRAYVTTMKVMSFNEEFLALPNNPFQNLYEHVFDLTSLQDAGEKLYYPEINLKIIR